MGIVDKLVYTLRCRCGAAEEQSIVQYGSAYSAGDWESVKPFKSFSTVLGPPSNGLPETVISAKCLSCGSAPSVSKK